MANNNKHKVIWSVLVIVLLALNLMLFINGLSLDCEKCTVKFKNTRISGADLVEPMLYTEIKARELFEEFKNDHCMIIYDRVQGYLKG